MQPRTKSEKPGKQNNGGGNLPSHHQCAKIRKVFRKNFKDDDFAELVNEALGKTGCNFLFEIPGVLFARPKARAAAVQSEGPDGQECFFIVHDMQSKSTKILGSDKVNQNILQLTRSYANVLGCLHGANIASVH